MLKHSSKMIRASNDLSHSIVYTPARAFSIVAPEAKLHFINHPRYGSVYPVVCMNDKQLYFRGAKLACLGSTLLNTSIIYSLFIQPIFVPAITSVICNPIFVLPSLFVNYALY
jgi:hypothetical protein